MDMNGPNTTIRNLLVCFHNRATLAQTNEELDHLLDDTISGVVDLAKWDERLLSEKEVTALPSRKPATRARRR